MALSDKDILITPNRGQTADPKIEFKGADASTGPQTITLNVYPTDNGTISFEGSAGQLFSVTNSLTGTIFSVNDVSGIPSIEVLDTGEIKLAEYGGSVTVGGTVTATGFVGDGSGLTNLPSNIASWIIKTSNYVASAGDKIIADTISGSFIITLPLSPSTGDSVIIADGNDWGTNNLTVARNGSTIEGLSEDLIIDIGGIKVEFVYDGSTWEIYTVASSSVTNITDDTSTDITQYLTMSRNSSSEFDVAYVSSTKLNFNPSTGTLNATNFNSLSDIAFKENIRPLEKGINILEKINPVSFNWKDNGNAAYGVIAQELEKVLPELVETTNGIKTVNYSQMIPFMISTIKELKKEVNQLRKMIDG